MNRFVLFGLILLAGVLSACSHATSLNGNLYDDTYISQGMRDTLWDDAAQIALKEAIAVDSSFIDSVTIPENRTRFYYKDLVSIYNSQNLPARDSIFVKYPIRVMMPNVHSLHVWGDISADTIAELEAQYHLRLDTGNNTYFRSIEACNIIALENLILAKYRVPIHAVGYGITGMCA